MLQIIYEHNTVLWENRIRNQKKIDINGTNEYVEKNKAPCKRLLKEKCCTYMKRVENVCEWKETREFARTL